MNPEMNPEKVLTVSIADITTVSPFFALLGDLLQLASRFGVRLVLQNAHPSVIGGCHAYCRRYGTKMIGLDLIPVG